jgi:uncharacterized protein YcbX
MVVVASLFRYPIKSLNAEELPSVDLAAGRCVEGDRAYAIAYAGSAYDDASGKWAAKRSFLNRRDSPGLARLEARFVDGAAVLRLDDQAVAIRPGENPDALTALLDGVVSPRYQRPFRLVSASAPLTDEQEEVVSILNLQSLAALSETVGAPLEQQRFSGNLWIEGLGAWSEFDLVGRSIRVGDAHLRVLRPIARCAAINVIQGKGDTNPNVLKGLVGKLGHEHFGVFAVVEQPGRIAAGDQILW